MKKFLFIVLLLLLLAVGGVVGLVMMSFNPTSYQRQVVESIQRLTGREVTVVGETSITWNPIPTVVMRDIRLANADKSEKPFMLSIESAKVTVAWESLLKSPLEIKSIELTEPVLVLERYGNNRSNFAFPFLLDPKFQLQEVDLLSEDSGAATKISSIVIKNGTVKYSNQITGTQTDITNLNGELAVDTVRGPFRFKGQGIYLDKSYQVSASVGMFQGTSPINVKLGVSEQTMGAKADITGQFTPTSVDKWFEGAGTFSLGKTDAFLEMLNLPAISANGGQKMVGSVTLIVSPAQDTLKDLTFQLGEGDQGLAVVGTFSRTILGKTPSYSVSVGMDTFRYEDWKAYLNRLDWKQITGEDVLPNVTFDFKAQDVSYAGEHIRNVAVGGRYEDGVLVLTDSSVVLPGETNVKFSGTSKVVEKTPLVELNIQAATEKAADLLQWMLPGHLADDKLALLNKGDMKGRIAFSPDRISMAIDELKMNDTTATGALFKTRGETPTYGVKLSLENFNCDIYSGWKSPAEKIALADLPEVIKSAFVNMKGVADWNMQASIDIQDGTLFGVPVSKLHFGGVLSNNTLRIDRLSLQNWAGAIITGDGQVSGLGREQARLDNMLVTLDTTQLPLLLDRLKIQADLPLIAQATDAKVKLGVKGARDGAWDIDLQALLSDANMRFSGILDTPETEPTFEHLTFYMEHPSFKAFMELVEPSFNYFPKLDGSFKAKGTFAGSAKRFELTDAAIGIGLQQLTGSVAFDNGKVKTLTIVLAAPWLDLDRFESGTEAWYSPVTGLSEQAFDFSALDRWDISVQAQASKVSIGNTNVRQANLEMRLQNKELSLVKLEGTSGASDKTPIRLSGKLDWNTTPKLTAEMSLQNVALRPDFLLLPDFAFGGGELSLNGDISARGDSPAELVRQLNGKGTLAIRGGQMIGTSIEQMIPIITRAVKRKDEPTVFEPEFHRVLNSGKTVIKDLTGDFVIANGVVRMMDATLTTAESVANPMQVIWDMPNRMMDISIPVTLKPLDTLPPFILGISIGAGRGSYKPNYSDLSAALSNQSQTALAEDLKQREEAAQLAVMQTRTNRLTESRDLTMRARDAVVTMEQKLKEFPFEKGQRLLQSARDALALVNQLAVREEPTDAQLIQQIEQARLVLVRADEFQKALEQEAAFNAQSQITAYQEKSHRYVAQLKAWSEAHPDIDILTRLADNAVQNGAIVDQLAAAIQPNMNADQMNRIVAAVADATEKIEKAYQHAARFDLSDSGTSGIEGRITVPETSGEVTPAVRGSFRRSK